MLKRFTVGDVEIWTTF